MTYPCWIVSFSLSLMWLNFRRREVMRNKERVVKIGAVRVARDVRKVHLMSC